MTRPPLGYRLLVRAARAAAPLAARADDKIARGVRGRRGLAARFAAWARAHRDPSRPLVWFHAPSVGEGLQAKPVLDALRAGRPDWQLAYTFFSPSAERMAAGLPADVADYAPYDRPDDVAVVLDALQPSALVYAKLDVWPELTLAAAARRVRLGLIAATVSPGSGRLRWPVRGWLAPAYGALDRVGAISAADAERLALLGVRSASLSVTGDTRYDSVTERISRLDPASPHMARARGRPGAFTIVAGSTWPPDEAVVLPAFAALRQRVPTARLLLAPHEATPEHFAGIAQRVVACGLDRPARLSRVEPGGSEPVIVVDRVGVLADLYAAADAAYVGGGFHRAGLHSVLEPAACGAPVTFGPRWHDSRDAELLIAAGGAAGLPPQEAERALLAQWLAWHADPAARGRAATAARELVTAGRGAAQRTAALVTGLVEGR